MPLTINLKPGEKLIVNGVVVQNTHHAAKLIIHNEAALLRQKDILAEPEANTPARRIYFAVQCQYLFPERSAVYTPLIHQFLQEFSQAAPSTLPLIREIAEEVQVGHLYQALKSAKRLITKEQEILNGVTAQGIHQGSGDR
jgi:flagellar biosynthesis repressor protein FlbT